MDRFHVIAFSVFAVLAVVFGFIQIGKNVKLSFNIPEELLAENDARETAEQQLADTDDDGLRDYEELNVYGTSPYLADSDSDGISDSEEIKNGTNPNCPEGTNCSGDFSEAVASQDQAPVAGEIDSDTTAILEALSILQSGGTPSPEQVRKILLSSGITEVELAGSTDEELLELMQVVMQEINAAQAEAETTP